MPPTSSCCLIPVLFLIHRRVELTKRVLAAIREVRPTRLLLAADGPEEDEQCQRTRRMVLEGIDWPCEVQTRFSATRQGCRRAVWQALNWAFAEHEQVIVIEDDCLPDAAFFLFCSELLERYQNVPEIMQICGSQFEDFQGESQSSYYASRFPLIWGWATWRRAWQKYDGEMSAWPKFRSETGWKRRCRFQGEVKWRTQMYDRAHAGEVDAWSIAWDFAHQCNAGISLVPRVNLVSNIGWGNEATHTHDKSDPRANLPTTPLAFPLRHPETLTPDDSADEAYFSHYCRPPSLMRRVIRKMRKVLGR